MSFRRSYDTEIITLRQINALNTNNSIIPALHCLTSDGKGGTYWAAPSSLGGIPSFNNIVVDNVPLVANSPYNTLFLSSASGIGFAKDPVTKEVNIFSKGFQSFELSQGNTINSYSNSILSPTVKWVGMNGIEISSDPSINTIYLKGIPTSISTGTYAYHIINVIENDSMMNVSSFLVANSYSTILNLIGEGDIRLTPNISNNSVSISISSFNSQEYKDLIGVAYGTLSSALSTVSTLFYDEGKIGEVTSSIVFDMGVLSTGISEDFRNVYNTLVTDYIETSYFTLQKQILDTKDNSLQTQITTVNTKLFSTITFLSSLNTLPNTQDIQTQDPIGLLISSQTFNMDSMSSIYTLVASAEFTYRPALIFNSNTNPQKIFYVSTFIQVGNTMLPSTLNVRPWIPSATNSSNVYSDNVSFHLHYNDLLNSSSSSTFTIFHNITDASGFPSNTFVKDVASINNSAVIRFYNGF